jgi:polyisoprenyl-phosphate glycosyltransferase
MRSQHVECSVVVPVFRNAEDIGPLLERLTSLSKRLPAMEAVLVVDGSPDESFALLRQGLESVSFPSQLIAHARNFGSFAAIRTGLAASLGACVVTMAADLQEPEDLVVELVQSVTSGDGHQIAIGTRTGRDDPVISRWLSALFWRLHRRLVQGDTPRGGVDVFACTRPVADHLVAMQEANSSLIGLLFWLGFPRTEIPYRRLQRERGSSGWTLRRRLRYAVDSIFSFTALPITLLVGAGLVGSIITFALGANIAIMRLIGRIEVPGYTALMLAVLFSTFVVLLALGIVGSYVWRAFENSKGRPGAVSMVHHTFNGSPAQRPSPSDSALP